jgi:type VII secretion integral membrane protein EccD
LSVNTVPVAEPPVTGSGPGGLCRLAVRAPDSSFDLAVPTDIRLADLLPAVIGYAGADLDESGIKHGGWVLQRLGEAPLAPEGTADSHNLHDGEVLYLRPARDAMPAVHFDDLVNGVMSSLNRRADSWRPVHTRRLLLAVMVAVLALGVGVLLLTGPVPVRVAVAAGVGVILAGAGMSASRAVGDVRIGTWLAGSGIAYLVLAAVLVPAGSGEARLHACLLAGGMAAVGASALGFGAVGGSAPFFLGTGAAGLLTAVAGAMYGATVVHDAALTAFLVVVAGIFIPSWAFWLSGLRLPPLPANADQLQEGIDPHPSDLVESRTALADGYLTGLLTGAALVYTGALAVLVIESEARVDLILAGAFSLLAVLHGRTMGAIAHRLAVVVPGVIGAGLLAGRFAWFGTDPDRMLLVPVLLTVAALLTVTAVMVPGRRMVPHWARAGEIAHSLVAVSLLPLMLLTLGIYHRMRGFGG